MRAQYSAHPWSGEGNRAATSGWLGSTVCDAARLRGFAGGRAQPDQCADTGTTPACHAGSERRGFAVGLAADGIRRSGEGIIKVRDTTVAGGTGKRGNQRSPKAGKAQNAVLEG